jgi:hypothetical protein
MAAKTEPQTAVSMKTVPATNGALYVVGSPPDPLVSPFGQMRTLVEQMVKDSREEGRKAGIAEGRAQGIQRAARLLAIAVGKMSTEEKNRLADVLDQLEEELTR